MNLMGTTIDYVILILYFVFILAFGAYFARFTKSTKDFFFGGQRFSWWLIAASLVATGIGSYSFLKYAQTGFTAGMSSTMTYLNDWFMIPLFMFGWLPIIYFSRIKSIPEYFDRRFDRRTRLVATIFTLLYLLGYIGLNFYLMGLAMRSLLGIPMWFAIPVVAVISAIYVTTGGQTAVIFTDLIQGLFLYIAGAILLIYGLSHVGGLSEWWANLDVAHRLPFPGFNRPAEFEFTGIFWGEGIVGTLAFTFINQGFIMRYLAVKSVNEGRKTLTFNTLLLMPISAVVVGCIGWIAASMVTTGHINTGVNAKDIFMIVANIVTRPGIFGFVIAALTAALMSTIDTLINAVAAIGIFDVYKNYIKKEAPDKHYLRASRVVSIIATLIGLALVPAFAQSRSILQAHYAFIAMISPPMLVAIFLGVVWKRFTPKGAFWGMIIGGLLILMSIIVPDIIVPIARTHGLTDGSEANIVFEAVADGPIMGPRGAYNWQEIFTEEDGSPTDFVIEYELRSQFDGTYTNIAPVWTRFDTINGTPVQRFCANLTELKPRDNYSFRVVNRATGEAFDAVWDKGLDDDKLPIIELVDSREMPESAPGNVSRFGFRTAGEYSYFRSLFGLVVTLIAGVAISLFTKPKKDIDGLSVGTIWAAKRKFKGGEPNEVAGEKVVLDVKIVSGEEKVVYLPREAMERLKANPGDLLYIADHRKRLGGLRSNHIHAGEAHDDGDFVIMSAKSFAEGNFRDNTPVRVEKII
ncbi:MAG TPA: sodium:solute symporter family protein [candidate division Zixibacteria bacterium]|nr:sodium:solute symporter family protein [candidate division Zixibacteria bacterium]